MAGTEIATAYVSLVVSGDKVAPGVRRALGSTERDADRAGQTAGRRFGSAFSTRLKQGAAVGVGLAAAGVFKLGKDSVKAASDLGESVNAVNVTFGKSAKGILGLSKAAADGIGMSREEFNGLAVRFSSFAGTVAGKGGSVVKTMDDLTTRAADFASVMNLDVAQAAELFQSGLAGETEPLRKYGLDLSAASVQAYAYANGIAKAGSKLTETQKVQARYGSLMEQTSKTQGDFVNTSDSLANAQRRLGAQFENVKADLGQALLPVMEDVTGWLANDGLPAFSRFVEGMREGRGAGGDVAKVFGDVRDAFSDALPYARRFVNVLGDVPSWAIKGGLGGLALLYGAKKLNNLTGGAAGGAVGKLVGGGVQKVFVVNMAPGMGGPGGGGTGRAPIVATGGRGAGRGAAAGAAAKSFVGWTAAITGTTFALDRLTNPKYGSVLKDLDNVGNRLGGTFSRLRVPMGAAMKTTGEWDAKMVQLDRTFARTIQRNPAQGYRAFKRSAREAGVSVEELSKALPGTARRIEQTGARAKFGAKVFGDWKREIVGGRREVDRIDGKKPTVKWSNPGLIPGITNTGRLKGGINDVDGKKPKAFFSLPGIMQRVAEANRLNDALNVAARDRRSVITVTRNVVGGARGLAGVVPGFADGGRPRVGQLSLVGERGPELFVPDRPGRIVPNDQIGAGLAGGGPVYLMLDDGTPLRAYVARQADARIGAHRQHAASRGR